MDQALLQRSNPTHGSGWFDSDHFYKTSPKLDVIPPTAVGGSIQILSTDLSQTRFNPTHGSGWF